MNEHFALQHSVMRRVRRIYRLRFFINPFLLKVYGLSGAFVLTASFVSVPNILANMPAGLSALLGFFTASFLHTEVVVQILTLGALLFGFLVIRDSIRLVGQSAGRTSISS